MFVLTKEERQVLFLFCIIFFLGSLIHYAFNKYSFLHQTGTWIESEILYQRVDINTAGLEELLRIPGVGPVTGQKILEYRDQHGPFSHLKQIQSIKGISEKRFYQISKYLKPMGGSIRSKEQDIYHQENRKNAFRYHP